MITTAVMSTARLSLAEVVLVAPYRAILRFYRAMPHITRYLLKVANMSAPVEGSKSTISGKEGFRVGKPPFLTSPENQWNPKYGCKGTVTTRFALIALVAWQY